MMKNIAEIKEELSSCRIQGLNEFISMYGKDERSGVKKLVSAA